MSQAGISGTMGGGGRIVTTISTFNPNQVLQEFDDFIESDGHGDAKCKLQWVNSSGNSPRITDGTAAHPGIITLFGGIGSNSVIYQRTTLSNGSSTSSAGPFALGGGVFSQTWNFKLDTLSNVGNRYTALVGLGDAASFDNINSVAATTFVNGIFFSYSDNVNGGNWVLNCRSSSVSTTFNTTTAADTNFHSLTISANAGASTITFLIDNVSVGTISTNIPTSSISPGIALVISGGGVTVSNLDVDLYYLQYTLSTPRPGPTNSSVVVGTGMLIEQYVQTGVNYQVLATDAIIGCSAGNITITLPATPAATGQVFTIKDESGTAAASNITVSGNGKNIDGAATYVINTNFGAISVYYNGSNFFVE